MSQWLVASNFLPSKTEIKGNNIKYKQLNIDNIPD